LQHSLLRSGGVERKNLLDRGTGAVIQLEGNAGLCLLLTTFKLKPQLNKKQLLEDEADMSRGAGGLEVLNTFARLGPVHLLQGFSWRDEAQVTAHHCRDRVGQIRREVFERGVDRATKPPGGQTALSGG